MKSHKSFEKELSTLKTNLKQKDDQIKTLENKIEGLEMYGRRNEIRIYGVPENDGESTDDIVLGLAEKIGASIPKDALGRSHRVGRKVEGRPRAIIAKFVGHNHKVTFLRNKKNLRDNEEDPTLNDIFVNEDLTSKRVGWVKKARDWKRAKKIKDVWTRDGILFIKNNQNQVKRVENDSQLDNVYRELPDNEYLVSTDSDGNEEDEK